MVIRASKNLDNNGCPVDSKLAKRKQKVKEMYYVKMLWVSSEFGNFNLFSMRIIYICMCVHACVRMWRQEKRERKETRDFWTVCACAGTTASSASGTSCSARATSSSPIFYGRKVLVAYICNGLLTLVTSPRKFHLFRSTYIVVNEVHTYWQISMFSM